MKRLDKKDGKTRKMDTYLDTKSERRFLLIGWLMGVEQNSVYLSRILVVGCAGLFECEELVGVTLHVVMGLILSFNPRRLQSIVYM